MATPLKRFIESRYGGRGLPVALVLPDGGRIALSPTPEIDLIVRSWRGVKALAAPALGTLARAYVHQDIDFTGSAKRALAVAESMAGSIAEGGHSLGAGIRGIWHRRRGSEAGQDRAGTPDPVSAFIWQEGHLLGGSSEAPVIKAPRASDLTTSDAA